jgi:SAM-dependent methyltransferase
MVERAVRKAERHGVEVAFRVCDVSDPPMAAPVDVVIGRHILWALPDPAAALDRWIGLLAPGGTLILVEGRWHTGDGLVADELLPLVASRTSAASVRHLPSRRSGAGRSATSAT